MTSVTGTEVRMPKPPGVFRRFLAAHPLGVDVFIVVWYIIGACFGLLLDSMMSFSGATNATGVDSADLLMGSDTMAPNYLAWPWWPFAVLRIIVVAASLLYRRRFPLIGLMLVALATFGDHQVQSFATFVALCFMLYAVPVYRSVRTAWLGYSFVALTTLIQAACTVRQNGSAQSGSVVVDGGLANDVTQSLSAFDMVQEMLTYTLLPALGYLAILMLGINLGNRRRYVEAIIDRAHQLMDERDQRARLAVAEERARISREMHDIVAHSLSVMIALSEGASRATANAPDAASHAMRKSAETGRAALAEMRRLLGALRMGEESAELAPQPGMEDLPGLAQSFRDAGLRVGLRIDGHPSGDRGQELAVYRATQEALTNVLRYAGRGAQANVIVRSTADATNVTVRDFGPVSGVIPAQTGLGAGLGIAGLSERARMLGGEAHAGPVSNGPGWEMRVRLPAALSASDPDRASSPKMGAAPVTPTTPAATSETDQ